MINLLSKKYSKNKNKQMQSENIINTIVNDLLTFDEKQAREEFEKDFQKKCDKNDNLKRINEVRERMKKDITN